MYLINFCSTNPRQQIPHLSLFQKLLLTATSRIEQFSRVRRLLFSDI